MPKAVEASNPYVGPPAANIEDVTQPMGPLEKGDQALVDAAHLLPEGRHEIRRDDGSVSWVNKFEQFGHDIAAVDTLTADGSHEHASTYINKVPGLSGVSAELGHSAAWNQGIGSRARVSDNRIGTDVTRMKVGTHRAEAQAIKLEVAGQIDAARKQLGRDAVEGAQR